MNEEKSTKREARKRRADRPWRTRTPPPQRRRKRTSRQPLDSRVPVCMPATPKRTRVQSAVDQRCRGGRQSTFYDTSTSFCDAESRLSAAAGMSGVVSARHSHLDRRLLSRTRPCDRVAPAVPQTPRILRSPRLCVCSADDQLRGCHQLSARSGNGCGGSRRPRCARCGDTWQHGEGRGAQCPHLVEIRGHTTHLRELSLPCLRFPP